MLRLQKYMENNLHDNIHHRALNHELHNKFFSESHEIHQESQHLNKGGWKVLEAKLEGCDLLNVIMRFSFIILQYTNAKYVACSLDDNEQIVSSF